MNRILALALAAGTATAVIAGNGSGTAQAASPTNTTGTAYGWSAVTYHPTSKLDNRGTLRLVSPTGAMRTIGKVTNETAVMDVSRDGRRVVTARMVGNSTHFALWDTATKKARFLNLPGFWSAAYTKTGLVTWTNRAEHSGARLMYHRTFSGVATARYSVGDYTDISVPGDGSRFIEVDRTKSGGGLAVVRSAATGSTLSRTALPNRDCWGSGEWSPTTYQVECPTKYSTRPYALAYNGTMRPTALAGEGARMLRTSPRTALVHQEPGSYRLMKVTRNGFARLPGVTPDTSASGAFGTTVFTFKNLLQGRGQLARYDLTTGTTRTLTGGSRGGLVTSGLTIDGVH